MIVPTWYQLFRCLVNVSASRRDEDGLNHNLEKDYDKLCI